MFAKSCKYPSEGGERYRDHVRRNVLQDLGIKLVEEIVDTDQHYTIKVDTEDEEDFIGSESFRPNDRVFTARISVCPVQYRRMEMMKIDECQPAATWRDTPKPAATCQSLLRRLWQWANEPIVYDGPMPSPRPVAATQKQARCDPADEHDSDWWDEQEREEGICVEGA